MGLGSLRDFFLFERTGRSGSAGGGVGAVAVASMVMDVPPVELALVLTLLYMHLKKLHAMLPPRTVLIIFRSHLDPLHCVAVEMECC